MAERVGALAYDLVMNTVRFEKGMQRTRSSLKTLNSNFKKASRPVEEYEQRMRDLTVALGDKQISPETFTMFREQEVKALEKAGFVMDKNGKVQKTQVKQLEEKIAAQEEVNRKTRLEAKLRKEEAFAAGKDFVKRRDRNQKEHRRVLDRHLQIQRSNARGHRLVMLNLQERMRFMSNLSPGMAAGIAGNLAGAVGASGATIGAVRGATMLGAKLAVPIGGFLALGLAMKKAVAEADRLRKTTIDLSVLLGNSDESAVKLVKNFQKLARQTPLTTMQLAEGARQLLAFGRESRFVEEDLRRLGTIAGGDVERMRLLTKAFADVTAAGKLQGQELRQFTNQGFNPLREMVEMTGKSYAKLRREMELGLISADMVADSMASASERYAGRLEASMNTVAAQYARLKGIIDEMFAQGGGPSQEVLVDVMKGSGNLLSGMKELADDTVLEMRELGRVLGELWEDTKVLVQPEVFAEGAFKRTRKNMKEMLSDPFRELEETPESGITGKEILKQQELSGFNAEIAKLIKERVELLADEDAKLIKLTRELKNIKEIDTSITQSRIALNQAIRHGGQRGIDDARKSLELAEKIKRLQDRQQELKDMRKREIEHEKRLHDAKVKDISDIRKRKMDALQDEFKKQQELADLASKAGGPSDDFTAAGADYRFVQQRRNEIEAARLQAQADKKREQQIGETNEIMTRMERAEELRHQEFMDKLQVVQ